MQHHAYIHEGTRALLGNLVADARARFGQREKGDPDVHVYETERFTIDDARALYSDASLRSLNGRSLFIVWCASMTSEAQQALLKLSEEPSEGMVLLLLVPHGILIPALRSRFLVYPTQIENSAEPAVEADTFLASSHKERSAFISELLEAEDTKDAARSFLDHLEIALYPSIAENKEVREALGDIAMVRSYLSDRSPSLKMLFEHLAATLPKRQ